MRYRIHHETTYHYSSDVMHSHHLLHLVPRPSGFQQCLTSSIDIVPAEHRRVEAIDAFGNPVIRIELSQPHREFSVISEMQIEVYPRPTIPMDATRSWNDVLDDCAYRGVEPGRDDLAACRFRHESSHVHIKQLFHDYSEDCFRPDQPILSSANALSDKLFRELTYAPGETTISTSPLEVLKRKRGVCQDFAHLMIACLRARGLPARYVSGYLRTVNSATKGQQELIGAGATHAWVAVWCPPFGWIEFDPTNGGFVGVDHVSIAWGRDFADVSPLKGVILGGADHELTVKVYVMPEEAEPDDTDETDETDEAPSRIG
jgi:transglutaminase-like putative cysteine protease